MEKDNDSMVVKPVEYAPSEYSASSEAPPAYKLRQADSVKIAKIVAFTVILSSFILGSFMLASTYLQARATCDQVSALDAILDKELMLETMQQDLPKPEALLSQENTANNVQDLSKDEMNKPNKKDQANLDDVENINEEEEETNSIDNGKRVHVKLPLDFDLTELAHNILMNNQKSRMNCVVERRRTEEVEEPKSMNPFINLMNEAKKEKVTGERLSIFCETGEPKVEQDPMIHIRRIVLPFPMGPMGPQFQPSMNGQFPPVNMPPPRFPPHFPPHQEQPNMPINFPQPPQTNFPQPPMRIPFQRFPQQQAPPMPAQMMSPPRPEVPQFRLINPAPQQQQLPNFERPQQMQSFEQQEEPKPELRIQLRRIQIPGPIGDIFPFLNNIHNEAAKELDTPRQNVQIQQMPLAVALSKVGITPEDLKNIQRMAEEKFQEHIRELVADEDDSASDSESHQSEDENDSAIRNMEQDSAEQKEDSTQKQQPQEHPQILALGRSNFGRSLALNPVQLPGNAEIQEAERAEFVQPR